MSSWSLGEQLNSHSNLLWNSLNFFHQLQMAISTIKQLGVLLPFPEWDASPLQGYPPALICQYPVKHLGGESHHESSKPCPRTQHMTLAWSCTQYTWSGVQSTNRKTPALPNSKSCLTSKDTMLLYAVRRLCSLSSTPVNSSCNGTKCNICQENF